MLKLLLAIVAWFCTALSVSSWSFEESERVSVHVLGVDELLGENSWERIAKKKIMFSLKALNQTGLCLNVIYFCWKNFASQIQIKG